MYASTTARRVQKIGLGNHTKQMIECIPYISLKSYNMKQKLQSPDKNYI